MRPRDLRGPRGFSLIELVVVLAVAGITLGIAVAAFGFFRDATAARRAAETFSRDLTMARGVAVRERSAVSIVFDEAERSYVVRTAAGREIQTRDFGRGGEIPLSEIALEFPGDSLTVSGRGVVLFGAMAGPLGVARFRAGSREYFVQFNALAATRIDIFN